MRAWGADFMARRDAGLRAIAAPSRSAAYAVDATPAPGALATMLRRLIAERTGR